MAKTKLITVIDCPICKASEAIRVYEVYEIDDAEEYLTGYDADCWKCGYRASFNPGLFEDESAYEYYKELVSNNCVDLAVNSRLFKKVAFAIMCAMRGEDFWQYIPKLPDSITIICPNCLFETRMVHNPWNAFYKISCYGCGFKGEIHEDTVYEEIVECRLDPKIYFRARNF
jgi:Zn ribbon nucleic-acid-binding protein